MNKNGCPPGQIRFKGKCVPGLTAGPWIAVKIPGATDIKIYRRSISLDNYVGELMPMESDWQPASIQISKDTMKEMEESNTAIFFEEKDLSKKKWKNKAIHLAK